ncbi:hypothetical protein [Paludibacter jiangxiensis]|uniref:Lipoprotein n=1 Tax=Paludibacter jiangxiensis TaxID=681398 RepID=A0A161LUM3_9BACT|nr:hypothetical protein [Paludibacter jiangxiensis]GAT62729.1 hypothetical protein PJIAN_332 [Paludibacter jiangxiensis]
MKKIVYLLFAIMLFSSCSGLKELQTSFRQFGGNLEYIHDSHINGCPKKDSVVIMMHDYLLDGKTTVRKGSMLILPFLFFNYFEQNYWVTLGQEALNSRYDDFFNASLTEECQRNGCFHLTGMISNDSTYTLEIGVDTCYTRAKYKRFSSFVYFGYGYESLNDEYGKTPKTTLKVSAVLRKAGNVIFRKQYVSENSISPGIESGQGKNDPRGILIRSMTGSLSLSTKQCIEEIVTDINKALLLSTKK